ncbi:MAG TPA: hypothetical protein PLP01_07095 [Phycisphaerae bacterium]|nr:hypothetical protein [Phycisphaerae bacterium]HOI55000.1 hypothetical protein [Phycisphaerae bacterium]
MTVVVVLIACLGIFSGIFCVTAALSLNRQALAAAEDSAAWAADAGLEDALARLAAGRGRLQEADRRFVLRSNHCHVDVAIEPLRSGHVRVTSEATYEPTEADSVHRCGHAAVTADVAINLETQRLHVVSWSPRTEPVGE